MDLFIHLYINCIDIDMHGVIKDIGEMHSTNLCRLRRKMHEFNTNFTGTLPAMCKWQHKYFNNNNLYSDIVNCAIILISCCILSILK